MVNNNGSQKCMCFKNKCWNTKTFTRESWGKASMSPENTALIINAVFSGDIDALHQLSLVNVFVFQHLSSLTITK